MHEITQIEQTFRNKNILFGILNWGLGHATRMVPIINTARAVAKSIVVCGNGASLNWLTHYFPDLNYISLDAPEVRYAATKAGTFYNLYKLWINYPSVIKSELQKVALLVKEHKIDLIVSDNRPGIYNPGVHSVYITHQLNVKAPLGLSYIATKQHTNLYACFNEIWVPDFKDDHHSLAGYLSRNRANDLRVTYIGPLSRFKRENKSIHINHNYHLAILSGPEPQRTIFENEIIRTSEHNQTPLIILRGLPQQTLQFQKTNNRITFVNTTNDTEFADYVLNAQKIFCRSGYSTIMDLHALGCINKAVFKATPGQSEQEYLEKYWNKKRLL